MKKRGFTLIDVLVGAGLTVIVFLAILGAYQLGLQAVGQSKNKIIASGLANQQLEHIRNLPYESIGLAGGFPEGVLAASTTTVQNGTEFMITTRIDFVVDGADGLALPEDDCPNDYKKSEVIVSWAGRFPGEIRLSSDIAPKNISQECATAGGILSVSVFNAQGQMISFPSLEIRNPLTEEVLKTAAPESGEHYFALATSTYKVVVSKTGYNGDFTRSTSEIAIPEKPHPIILKDQITEISFSIDRVSSFSVDTLSPWGQDFFSDSFADTSKISDSSQVVIGLGFSQLATTSDGYLPAGYMASNGITPASLVSWDELAFNDLESAGTDLKYQIYYASGTDWFLVPDIDLPQNLTGFDVSPVDISGLDISYFSLKIRANFSTNSTTSSPIAYDWQVSWKTSQAMPIGFADFQLRGEKIIGYDNQEQSVYKYSQNHTSNSQGHIDIPNLEWDLYTVSIDPQTGLDLDSTDPAPQPISLAPDTVLPLKLYLSSQNSLLATVQNTETLEPVFSASTTLYKTGYSQNQNTNESGQTLFIPLESAVYNINISAAGYLATSTQVSVSGDAVKTIKLRQVE